MKKYLSNPKPNQAAAISGARGCGVCPLRDMDFAGNDIGMIDEVESWEKCAQECQKEPNCKGWAWLSKGVDSQPSNRCYIKDRLSTPNNHPTVISGTRDC